MQAAALFGRSVPDGFVAKMISDTRVMSPYYPSMKVDFDAGRQMELDSMYLAPIQAVRAMGGAMPETESLYNELAGLQRHHSR